MTDQQTNTAAAPDQNVLLQQLQLMQEQMAKMQEKIDKSESKEENKYKKAKEKYNWPRNYNFTLYGWFPVLSYKSVKDKPFMDWIYRNEYGKQVSNHILELTLGALDERGQQRVVRAEVNEFNMNSQKSPKMPAEPIGNPNNPSWFKFVTEEFGEFIVSSNIIN